MLIAFIAGFFITRCAYDATGVEVEFETGLPPPYVVAVFHAVEFGYGCDCRFFPLHAELVYTNHVRFNGDFTRDGNAFVQVFTPAITNATHGSLKWTPLEENPDAMSRHLEMVARFNASHGKIVDGRDLWGNPDDTQFMTCMNEDRSQAYPLSRKVVSLSSNNSKIVTTDWMGNVGYADAPEGTEDGKLYPQGIKPKNKGTK